jgi:hypothetical protein
MREIEFYIRKEVEIFKKYKSFNSLDKRERSFIKNNPIFNNFTITKGTETKGDNESSLDFPIYNTEHGMDVSKLIYQTEDFMARYVGRVDSQGNYDVIFFLDKSARPAAYLFRRLYPHYLSDSLMPEIRFVNINGRGLFVNYCADQFQNSGVAVRETYGKHLPEKAKILIIDEFVSSGKTLRIAVETLREAFPESRIDSMVAYSDLPKWYGKVSELGVKDLSMDDYRKIALDRVNRITGKNYDLKAFFKKSKRKYLDMYDEIFYSIVGRVPYTKRGDSKFLRKARAELDRVIAEVLKLKVGFDDEMSLFNDHDEDLVGVEN